VITDFAHGKRVRGSLRIAAFFARYDIDA